MPSCETLSTTGGDGGDTRADREELVHACPCAVFTSSSLWPRDMGCYTLFMVEGTATQRG